MAEKVPQLPKVKQATSAIRNFLRQNLSQYQNLPLTDADIIANYIMPAQSYVQSALKQNKAANAIKAKDVNLNPELKTQVEQMLKLMRPRRSWRSLCGTEFVV